ncbi:MAG: hydrogenase subunit MbhD domain-containing protein [Dehalococcoidia bacterium]
MIWQLELVIYILLALFALIALQVRNLIAAVAALTIFSLVTAAMLALMGAPDVALTEAALGAGIVGVLLIGAISLLRGRAVD